MAQAFDPKDMIFKRFGSTGLRVPIMALGGWLTYGGTVKGDPVKECMKQAYDLGINMFDTAEVYANGQSEIEMGRVIREMGWKREELIITTKIFFGTGKKDPNSKGLSRKHIIEGTKESLKRLELDYVDILFCHRADPTVPMEEIVRAMNWCIDTGKTFYWGTSEWSAQQIEEAHGIAARLGLQAPVGEQPQLNMFHRERFEKEYNPLFKKYGMGTTIWSPLASGLLTGKYNDGIPEGSRFDTSSDFFKGTIAKLQSEEGKSQIDQLKALAKVAEKVGCSMAQLALIWTAKNDNVSVILLGASKPQQIVDNVAALKYLDKLTPEIMEEIEGILKNKPEPESTWGR